MNHFPLERNERFIRQVRRHWIVLVAELAPYVLFAVFPLFLLELFPKDALLVYGPWIQLLLGIYWIFIWSCVLMIISLHYLTFWIVTSHRLIHAHQRGFLSHRTKSIFWHEVQNREIARSGALEGLFGIGTLTLTITGRLEPFQMDGVDLHLLHSIHE